MADWRLRLAPDAWLLRGPAGAQRAPVEGDPASALAQLAPARRGGKLQVVLGDGALRYLALRWPDGVRSGGERAAWLAHRFAQVHGVAVPEWTIVTDRDAVGAGAIACAVPAALVAAVRGFADAHGLRLDGVAGGFVDAYNRLRRGFDEAAGEFGALALARDGRLSVGLWREGEWLGLRSQALGADVAATARAMIEAWRLGSGQGEAGGTLYAVGFTPEGPAGWRALRREDAAWA